LVKPGGLVLITVPNLWWSIRVFGHAGVMHQVWNHIILKSMNPRALGGTGTFIGCGERVRLSFWVRESLGH